MRKRNLLPVSSTLAFAIVQMTYIRLPFIGLVTPLTAWLILTLLFLIPLAVLNPYILAWRKRHGRDIEEEEKYSLHGSGIISLGLRRSHEEPSSRKDDRYN
jgi:hypothetical protein